MDLISLAVSILWLLIGVIIILGVVWLALYVVKIFAAIPGPVENAIWAIVLILILIAALTMLAGGGKMRLHLSSLGVPNAIGYSQPTVNNQA